MYAITCKTAPRPEPTEAELNAMIAEQSKPENLPAWWHEGKCQARERGQDSEAA